MNLDEAIKYAEEKVSEPSIAKYLKLYKEHLIAKLYELEREKKACESNIIISLPDYIVQSIKESTVCSYEKYKIYEAIKDGVVLSKEIKDEQQIPDKVITILENLKEKIKTMSHYESADGQDLVMVSDVGLCIDEYIELAQNETMCNDCIKKYKCEDEGKNDPAMTFCSGKEKEVDEKP